MTETINETTTKKMEENEKALQKLKAKIASWGITDIANVIKENISKNAKKIVAIIGDILSTSLSIFYLGVEMGWTTATIILLLLISTKPFLYSYINLIFKGESDSYKVNAMYHQMNEDKIREQLAHERETSEYKIQLAILKGDSYYDFIRENKNWNDSNEALGTLDNKNKT